MCYCINNMNATKAKKILYTLIIVNLIILSLHLYFIYEDRLFNKIDYSNSASSQAVVQSLEDSSRQHRDLLLSFFLWPYAISLIAEIILWLVVYKRSTRAFNIVLVFAVLFILLRLFLMYSSYLYGHSLSFDV